ncbi:hypothetical protein GWI33_015322 [Rhynchophorus ferrugineus]|uniref:Nucleolar complex protein 3 homolog n=1 Tax=Rhynchophorus ferrugineus TaxID=354439 RepID=A0A834M9V3_RHYFE|nr:hypothetical protein GWI33_015322 [Rhynchophorus ferrugineus]
MAVKRKVSKVKRNNQKKNKLVKQGVIKKQAKQFKKVTSVPEKRPNAPKAEYSDEESDHGEDMLGMVEQDDLEFLKQAVAQKSYSILNRVKYTGPIHKAKKRKSDDDDTLENDYEDNIEDTSGKRIKPLLPIKTQKGGLIHKEIVEDIADEDEKEETSEKPDDEAQLESENEESEEEEVYTYQESGIDISKPISAAQLLAARNDILRKKKLHIGTLSSGLLENPEEKIDNLKTLLKLMDEYIPEIYVSVRKLVIVSLLEVFKDILPLYEIKNVLLDGVKVKKDTLKLHKYEEKLLQYYKKFLQKLEKCCFKIVKKKGDTRKINEEDVILAELSIQAMCELLVTHPYFNFSQNITQVLVPFLNSPRKNVRDVVKHAIETVFKEDKKEEITLKILRLINNYLKSHTQVHVDVLEVLLVLDLRNVNLDQGKEQDIKQKKLNAKKSKILQMSKKERKRKKKLQELEKEMLETKAEENRQVKQQNLTEITKIIFNIYFRILKNSENPKLLGVCLEGLAKFAHCINLEYYIDIVNVLNKLLGEEWLGYREQLHCIQTIFIMLSGQGEAINIDPTSFYNSLYKDLLSVHAGRNHENALIVIKTLIDALIKRRRKLTNKRIIGFVKRLATLSLQLLHNGSLGCLGLIKTLMQLNRSIDILLDLDGSVGDGKYQPGFDDPEYANASNTALFEMVLLANHYHPVVRKFAKYIASGVPATGDGSLSLEYGKMSVEQLFEDFSMAEMAFNPAVPVMKNVQPKSRLTRRDFLDDTFQKECRELLRTRQSNEPFWISL